MARLTSDIESELICFLLLYVDDREAKGLIGNGTDVRISVETSSKLPDVKAKTSCILCGTT